MTASVAVGARAATASPGADRGSRQARLLYDDLMAVDPVTRRMFFRGLDQRDVDAVLRVAQSVAGTPYGLWVDDPVGFTEDVLGETTWRKQRDVLEAIGRAKRVAVPSAFGTGKCVAEDDRLPLADGRMVRAGDLVGTTFAVMGWAEDGTQTPRAARAEWNATETVYRLRTTSGREVIRNAAHPLWAATAASTVEGGRAAGTVTLTPEVRGWTPTGTLTAGDLVLVPERHHARGTRPVDRDHVALLGYLLGDGGTGDRQLTFTQRDGDALDEFTAICDRLDVELVPKRDRPYCYRLRGRLRPDQNPRLRARRNAVLELVDAWGLAGTLAPGKAFPDWAWTLPDDQLAVLLGRLFACDAWAYTREHRGRLTAQVAIALASERLIRDVEAAMLRLGIIGTVRHRRVKYDGGHRDAWEWACTDRDAILRLADTLDVPGKNHAITRVADAVAARTARRRTWMHRNAPPGYRWERVTAVEALPDPVRTVAIEVDGDHTFVTSLVEHNTHIAARASLWRMCVHPFGTSLTVTTATRFRQVQRQLWPHIRTVAKRADLPIQVDTTQAHGIDKHGTRVPIGYGFSAPPHDEAAVQGIHAPRLFIVVDEAGGIARTIGKAMRGLLTGSDTRMLAIGNPATDDENTWFEELCGSEDVEVVRISAYDAPEQTGEYSPPCRACPDEMPDHTIGSHLVDQQWIREAIADHGEDSNFVKAKVHAGFPKGGKSKAIPGDWVDLCVESPEPSGEDYVRVCDVAVGETDEYAVKRGAWIRLGVDVAAGGGDEFVVTRAVGDLITLRHTSSGAANTNSVDVAGKVLEEIRAAELLRKALGTEAKIRVKIDAIGVGWGVASTLQAWGSEGIHDAEIVPVVVSEDTYREDEASTMRPYRKRDELWLTGRALIQPRGDTGRGALRLRLDKRTAAQLSAPMYGTNSGGRTVIESKDKMKARGINSPDRAEAALLSVYEPVLKKKANGEFRVIV